MDTKVTGYAETTDKIALRTFLRNAWGKDSLQANEARWCWLFRDNPNISKNQPTVWLIKHGVEIQAHFATIPVQLKEFDRYYPAQWGIDLFVDPKARRTGLALQIMTHVANQDALLMAVGTNPISFKVLQKNDWTTVGKVPHLFRILNEQGMAHSKSKTWTLRSLRFLSEQLAKLFAWTGGTGQRKECQIQCITDFDARFDKLWKQIQTTKPILVQRNRSFLSWRYGNCYKRDYTIFQILRNNVLSGYCVLRIRRKGICTTGTIVDILTEKNSLSPLVGTIVSYFQEKKVNRVDCLIADKAYEWTLMKNGFLYGRSNVWLMLKSKSLLTGTSPLAKMKSWHVTGGDSDLDR